MGSTPSITIKRRMSGEPAVLKQYKDELSKELLNINVKREMVLAGALTFIIAMIFTMDLLSLDTQEESLYVSLASYPLHILLLLGSLAFLTITLGQRGIIYNSILALKLAHISINSFVLILCSIIAVNNELVGHP